MHTKDLKFYKSSNIDDEVLMIEAVNQNEEILFGLIYHEKSGRTEVVFTKAGAHLPIELGEFRRLLDEQEKVLRHWISTIKP